MTPDTLYKVKGTLQAFTKEERVATIVTGMQRGLCRLVGVKMVDGESVTLLVANDPDIGNFIVLQDDLEFMIEEGLIEWNAMQ